jgi:hypothetical protein
MAANRSVLLFSERSISRSLWPNRKHVSFCRALIGYVLYKKYLLKDNILLSKKRKSNLCILHFDKLRVLRFDIKVISLGIFFKLFSERSNDFKAKAIPGGSTVKQLQTEERDFKSFHRQPDVKNFEKQKPEQKQSHHI